MRLQEIRNKIDNAPNLTEVSNIIEELTEDDAKKLLKLYFYDKVIACSTKARNIVEKTSISAQNICYRYFGDYSGIELPIEDITENTPVGDYWFNYKMD